jgi:hypothetical protein
VIAPRSSKGIEFRGSEAGEQNTLPKEGSLLVQGTLPAYKSTKNLPVALLVKVSLKYQRVAVNTSKFIQKHPSFVGRIE